MPSPYSSGCFTFYTLKGLCYLLFEFLLLPTSSAAELPNRALLSAWRCSIDVQQYMYSPARQGDSCLYEKQPVNSITKACHLWDKISLNRALAENLKHIPWPISSSSSPIRDSASNVSQFRRRPAEQSDREGEKIYCDGGKLSKRSGTLSRIFSKANTTATSKVLGR
ncbi:hypothetical protein ACQKWADRAFT_286582 [Trichoderma austrokoningii]